MSQDGSARSDHPAGGQEELGGVSHSERMMADMMKMLANLTMQNQQLLQLHLRFAAVPRGRLLLPRFVAVAVDAGTLVQPRITLVTQCAFCANLVEL